MKKHRLLPPHPGDILREEFMIPLKLTSGQIAKRISVPRTRIERLTAGTIGCSADTALRLAKLLGTTSQLWMALQMHLDLEIARAHTDLKRIKPVNK